MPDSHNRMDRLYGRLLRLYPRAFCKAYASAMAETFERRRQETWARHKGRAYRWWFFVRELLGLAAAALRQRLAGVRRHLFAARHQPRGRTPTSPGHELMSGLTQDLLYAVRRLLHSPGFTAAAAITLGLGIGANAAIFSVVYGVVLQPLPYPNSDRVVSVTHRAPGIGMSEDLEVPQGTYFLYRDESRTLEAIALYSTADITLSDGGDAERVRIALATHTLDEVLQVSPARGRWIDANDNYANGTGVVVLSHGLWQRRFGSDPTLIGRTIRMNNFPFEIVGVMPKTFAFPDTDTEAWIPRVLREADGFGGFRDKSVARLKPDVSAAEAEADLNGILPLLRGRYRASASAVLDNARLSTLVQPLQDHVVGKIEQTLWILLGTVGFVLLIACANVANLFLVRAEARQREVAIRTALGAGRSQMVRYFLTESAVLAAVGGALGLLLAFAGVGALVASGPAMIPRLREVSISTPVLAFTAAVTLLAALLFGAIPAFRTPPNLVASLKEGGSGATAGRRRFHLRQALVCGQIALALVLLLGSGLMVRSFWHLRQVDPGFDAEGVLTFEIGLEGAAGDYRAKANAAAFHMGLLERVRSLPGVTSAGAVSCLPLSGWCGGDPLVQRGVPVDPDVIPPVVAQRTVAPGYFETARIPLLAGRLIERSDHEQVTDVVLVSKRLAELYWPDEDPLGKEIYLGMDPPDSGWLTIVGVVGDVQTGNLTDGPSPLIYFPMNYTGPRGPDPHTMTFTVRTSTPPLGLVDAIRREAQELDASVPFAHVGTLEQLVADSGMQMAFTMVLLVIAGGVALTLGLVGVYGVISYVVGQRRNEIGVRLALGARGEDVRRMVLQQSGLVAAAGLVLGLAGAFALTRLMSALLFGVSPTDPVTYVAVTATLLLVTLLASYLPARRAARIDPVEALR